MEYCKDDNIRQTFTKLLKTLLEAGVYKVLINNIQDNRNEVYIGATSRNLKDRLKEHLRKGNLNTALAQRAIEKDVTICWEEARIINKVQDHKDLFTAEKIEMLRCSKNNEKVVNINKQKVFLKHGDMRCRNFNLI